MIEYEQIIDKKIFNEITDIAYDLCYSICPKSHNNCITGQ